MACSTGHPQHPFRPHLAALILRLVEYRGQAGSATIQLPDRVRSAARVNLLERAGETLPVANGKAVVTLRAWEIATLRLEMT